MSESEVRLINAHILPPVLCVSQGGSYPRTGGSSTDTYLLQGRAQVAISRRFDAAVEERYIYQPVSDSNRNSTALEVGFWSLADFRAAVGYNFRDTRDSLGRDLQGRDKGVYLTLSTKLSNLFDLFGVRRPPGASSTTPGAPGIRTAVSRPAFRL